MNDPGRVRVSGPLAACRDGFAEELAKQGYTAGSAQHQVQLMAHLSRSARTARTARTATATARTVARRRPGPRGRAGGAGQRHPPTRPFRMVTMTGARIASP